MLCSTAHVFFEQQQTATRFTLNVNLNVLDRVMIHLLNSQLIKFKAYNNDITNNNK